MKTKKPENSAHGAPDQQDFETEEDFFKACRKRRVVEPSESQEETLYGIITYNWDGGGSGSELFRTIEEARAGALNAVENKQREDDTIYKDDPIDERPMGRWREVEENVWTNGLDNIAIQTYYVKNK